MPPTLYHGKYDKFHSRISVEKFHRSNFATVRIYLIRMGMEKKDEVS